MDGWEVGLGVMISTVAVTAYVGLIILDEMPDSSEIKGGTPLTGLEHTTPMDWLVIFVFVSAALGGILIVRRYNADD